MYETAIELIFIGNNPSEVEGYLAALRNSGIAVHAHQVPQDIKAISSAIKDPIDLVIYTCESGETGLPDIRNIIRKRGLTIPIIALAESCNNEAKLQLMSQGACDLVERKQNQLLVNVIAREFSHVASSRYLATIRHKLIETEQRCNLLTESSRDAIAYIHQGMHVKANTAYLRFFGLKQEDEIEGLPILDMIAPADHNKFKQLFRKLGTAAGEEAAIRTTCLHSDGTEFNAELNFFPAAIEGEPCTQVIIRNQSPSREIEEKLHILSTQDTHTGLCNRQYFLDALEDTLKSSNTTNEYVLLYITLDNFKAIRDRGGMLLADLVITELAQLLKKISSAEDLLARFGDHTFTLLTRLTERKSIISLAEKICRMTQDHDYKDAKLEINPTCSIGIVRASPEISNAHEFINRAYQAWDQASSEGLNQIKLADTTAVNEPTQTPTGNEADLEKLIGHALEHDQFRLVYQPIVSLHGDTRENYAVLVRLLDNNQEEIHPDHFLPQAESSGKMPELDRWVIRRAISELAKHRRMGHKVNFFINISGPSLKDDMLLLWICDCLREFEAKGSWLAFQIKDQDARNHAHELHKLLESLKKIKCKISIDHFGLAPRSDTALQGPFVDFVQFDQQLIEGLAGDQVKQDKLNQLNHLVQKLNIKTIAAGVDETNSLTILWSIGVNYIRGYFIQEPSPNINFDFKMESSVN